MDLSLAPLAQQWFDATFPHPTEAQRLAWPALAEGGHALLVAPTGSGKTLAAFLQPVGRLVDEALRRAPDKDGIRRPTAGIRVLYLSPLRALDADVHHNLHAPLRGIAQLAAQAGTPVFIDHAVRTGDTPARERRAAQKRPPHLLITTPESLYQLLGVEASRAALSRVELVIVDELHALADGKRGTHLALSLERLDELTAHPVQRLGLTATAEPLERLAALLVGDPVARPVTLLDARRARATQLTVEVAMSTGRSGIDPRVIRAADHVVRSARSLVFVGSRMQAERWRPALEQAVAVLEPDGVTAIGIHHGALSREVRVQVEAGLRDGSLRAVVATSSLELGIDIGAIDHVVQAGSPGGVARLVQRVGRAGHSPDAVSVGTVISRGGVDLLECALLARMAMERAIEPIRIPEGGADVLAQQVVAYVAAETTGPVPLDRILAMARRSYPFRTLSREALVRVIDALASTRLRTPRLVWDAARGTVSVTEPARRLARTSGGTITSRGWYRLADADTRETIGQLDEEFVNETQVGDRFSFGLGVYRVSAIRDDAVLVRPAPPGSARRPFWRGDRPMRAATTGVRLGAAVRELNEHLDAGRDVLARIVAERYPVAPMAGEAIADVLIQQGTATGLPHDRTIVVETYGDALGEPRIAIHAWHGRTVLEPWALLLGAALEAHLGGVVHGYTTDNGIVFAPPRGGPPFDAATLPRLVSSDRVRADLRVLLPGAAIAGAAFREAAERALLLPRMPFKKRTPLWMNRQRARDLMLTVREDPEHAIVEEALREVMDDRWDTPALVTLLQQLERGEVIVEHVVRKTPSLFAHGLEEAFKAAYLYEDDTPAAERAVLQAAGGGHGSFETPWTQDGLVAPADAGRLDGLAADLPPLLLLARARGPVSLEALAAHAGVSDEAMRLVLTPAVEAGEVAVGYFTLGTSALEVCDAELLAGLRRKALARARREIAPVSRRVFQRWLLERMRVGPFAAEGPDAFREALSSLALFPIAPESLERDLLRVRTSRYDPAQLDLACARGDVRYVLLENPARVVLNVAGSIEPMPRPATALASPEAERLREVFRERGALFFGDLVLASRLPVRDVTETLQRMLRAGEVTNDGFAPARAVLYGVPITSAGRYALQGAIDGGPPSIDALIERLLRRYGVVARPLVDAEELAPAWGAMRDALDQREARGEVRRGVVVEGLGAVQFAHTETIDALRASRGDVHHRAVLLSLRDPALVAEIEGIGRVSSTRVVVLDGEAIAVVERDGAVIRTLRTLTDDDRFATVEALRTLARLPAALRPFRALTVERVDDGDAATSAFAPALTQQGFERDGGRMSLPSFRDG